MGAHILTAKANQAQKNMTVSALFSKKTVLIRYLLLHKVYQRSDNTTTDFASGVPLGRINGQLRSLGVDVSPQVTNKILMHYRGHINMEPREVSPPHTDLTPLVDAVVLSGYIFLSKVLLRI